MSGPLATIERPTIAPAAAPPRRRRRLSTPGRLRVWAASLIIGVIVLLSASSAGVGRLAGQLDAIGGHDAPQSATASDLYFALSDLDAQAVTLIMLGDSETMSINRLNALRTLRERDAEVDTDISAATDAAGATDRDRINQLAAGLAVYRQWVWAAVAVEAQLPPQTPGKPPAAALGYYSLATGVLHGQLLPAASTLRSGSQADLTSSYHSQRTTAWVVISTVGVIGVILLIALVIFQRRLARRYRRAINPALLAATACTAFVIVAVGLLFGHETSVLRQAQDRDFGPYLALTQAQAIGYDAAGDASRYLIASDRSPVAAEITTNAACLATGGTCVNGTVLPSGGLGGIVGQSDAGSATGREMINRFTAYQQDATKVVTEAQAGQLDGAVTTLTGISRGDAALDFYAYNTLLDRITTAHRDSYAASMANARSIVTPWRIALIVVMVAAGLLIIIGVRPRLAEYR